MTLPNTGCFAGDRGRTSRGKGCATVLMKNWQLPLLGAPVFAIESVPRLVRQLRVRGVLVLDRAVGAVARAGARALRVAAVGAAELQHEAVDDAVEVQTVVEAALASLTKLPAVMGILSVKSSTSMLPREVSRIAVGFAMARGLAGCRKTPSAFFSSASFRPSSQRPRRPRFSGLRSKSGRGRACRVSTPARLLAHNLRRPHDANRSRRATRSRAGRRLRRPPSVRGDCAAGPQRRGT